ncbi:MAG TPA: hypothetical protein VIC85_10640 [Ktedonobacterales bacterium]|jgi:hypothetical protein
MALKLPTRAPEDWLEFVGELGESPALRRLWPGARPRGPWRRATRGPRGLVPRRVWALLPRRIGREGLVLERHLREGRFQRGLALITAFAGLLSGLEVALEHVRGSYGQRVMYAPVLSGPLLVVAAVWAVFSRRAARVMLPVVALFNIANGVVGFVFHVRGVQRKPGGWRLPVFNIVMGPPLFAPLLFAISGFLGLITSFLRRGDDPVFTRAGAPWLARRPAWARWLPRSLAREGIALDQDIREGRFQRLLGGAVAVFAVFNGAEALYSHYKNNFTNRLEWSPILLTPLLIGAGLGTIWSRTVGRVVLPIAAALSLVTGTVGFVLHVRGVARMPGGIKHPWYNLEYGPPLFAPLLFAATGFLGLLASLLRRGP